MSLVASNIENFHLVTELLITGTRYLQIVYIVIIIIIINEFHRDASLKQNFRAAEGKTVNTLKKHLSPALESGAV